MQNFFGFIDYNKNNHYLDSDNEYIKTYCQEYDNYTLYLSYNKHNASYSIDTKELLILFNGSVSNKKDLLAKVNSNSEQLSLIQLIEKAYINLGNKLFSFLEGNYNLIIFDKKKEYLILNKNKTGISPLSYHSTKDLIVFGSRVSDFKKAPNFTPVINAKSLANYLQFGAIIQPNSILDECYKVKAGTSSNFDLRKQEHFILSNWTLESEYNNKKIFFDESKIVEDTEALLSSAIKKTEVNKEKPVALSLSGGYDSSTIAALLNKNDYNVETFTIGFEDKKINEAPYAKAIATHLRAKHHEHYFNKEDILNIIPNLSKIYDEPFADHAAAPTLLTTEMIKAEGIENLFVGDGGDEVFATADNIHFFNRILALPYNLRKSVILPLEMININKLPYLKNINNLPTKYEKLLEILSSKDIPQMTKAKNLLFRESELKTLIKGYTQPTLSTFDEINFNGYNETVDEIIGIYFKTTMIDKELVKSYTANNHNNISMHTPFLDNELISYMAKVPSSIKIKEGIKKYILKEIAHKYIPQNLLDRPKSGFTVYFDSWMRNELKDLVYAQVNHERLEKDNIFNSYDIIKIRDNFYNGNNSYKTKLWRIFLFQLWYENFKDN